MAKKIKGRIEPDYEPDALTESFVEQMESGRVCDALVKDASLRSLDSLRGQALRIDRCLLQAVTLRDPRARRLELKDVRVEASDLANIDLAGGLLERVEIVSTRLTGASFVEAQLKSVLFRECKLDLALFRMARLQLCVFEGCNLADADLYGADFSGAIFRGCDLSRADLSHTKLAGADIRDCTLDGVRGKPEDMEGLTIGPDQAALLIGLFGVRVVW